MRDDVTPDAEVCQSTGETERGFDAVCDNCGEETTTVPASVCEDDRLPEVGDTAGLQSCGTCGEHIWQVTEVRD